MTRLQLGPRPDPIHPSFDYIQADQQRPDRGWEIPGTERKYLHHVRSTFISRSRSPSIKIISTSYTLHSLIHQQEHDGQPTST